MNRFFSIRLGAAALLALGSAACGGRAAAPDRSPELAALCDEYWEFRLRQDPVWATYLGDRRYDHLLPDLSAEGRAAERRALESFLIRARAVTALTDADRVTADILIRRLELSIEAFDHKFYQWDVDQMEGPHVWLFELVNHHPLKDTEGRRTFAARLQAFPRYMDQYIANLREGLREGRVAPRIAVDRVLDQLKAHLAARVTDWPISTADPEGAATHVRPAFEKLKAFLESEYRPREAPGLSALPGGEAAYRFRIRYHTSLDATAENLHRIGLDELAAIEREMRAIAKTDDLKEFAARLRADRANFATSREEYLEGFRRILRHVDAKLPQYFDRLPKTGYEVKAIEEYREKDSVAAFYYSPPEDGSRPGIFYANCYRPETRPRYTMAALAVHEAVPGHHLQIALAMELEGLPKFRRHVGFTAFVEGWALYTERLADEMGVYENDLERYGMLTYQAWRAARLVVDTGLHAFDWSRERAIEFFREHLALSDVEILNEIDRYIIWPGQALAYKVGQREIQALRAEAQVRLGARFDIRRFHHEVLRHGAIPLPTLRMMIERWDGE